MMTVDDMWQIKDGGQGYIYADKRRCRGSNSRGDCGQKAH